MLLGEKDRGLLYDPARDFEWLGRWHYRAGVGKVLSQDPESLELNWQMRAQLRLDLFRYRRLVPYLSAGTEVWQGPSWRFFPWGEAGVRLRLRENLGLIPFLSGGRRPELYQPGDDETVVHRQAKGYLYAGMRMEASLGAPDTARGQEGEWQFLPEIHGKAGYYWVARSRYFGWGGDLEVALELLRRAPWTLFLYTGFHPDMKKSDLSIKKGRYWLQYGLTYSRTPLFAEAFLEHSKRLDGKSYAATPESAHLVGVRLGTQGMKPGYHNYGISFDKPGFHWLHMFHGQLSAGHYFQNQNWQYLWNVGAQGRWDLCRYYFVVPYLSGGIAWLNGGGSTKDGLDGFAEGGLRLHGKLDVTVFYRFQHQTMGRPLWGPADNRSLVGVQALF